MDRTRSVLLKSLGLVVVYFAQGVSAVSGQSVRSGQADAVFPPRPPRSSRGLLRSSTPPREDQSRSPLENTALVAEVDLAAALSARQGAHVATLAARVDSPRNEGAGAGSLLVSPHATETVEVDRGASAGTASPPQELGRRVERRAPSQGMRGTHYVDKWDIPETWTPGTAEVEWPEWVFEGKDLYIDEAPPYAEIAPLPLFYVHAPQETELKRKVKKLVRKKLFREVRRHTKRRWRKLFKASPTMRFVTYEETLAKINHIGKGGAAVDEFNDEFRTNEAKDRVFRRESRRGEPDIPLFTWGPLTVTDSGEVRFDMGTVAATHSEDVIVEKVEVGGKKAKPLFSGKDYKLNTSLKLSLNDDVTGGENYLPFLSSYGFSMEVEWLSDILGREMVGAELEVEFDDDGDGAAFFNFVIKSRS